MGVQCLPWRGYGWAGGCGFVYLSKTHARGKSSLVRRQHLLLAITISFGVEIYCIACQERTSDQAGRPMKSLSLEMLTMVDLLAKSCFCGSNVTSPVRERKHDIPEQDDSIPAKTQRHLASFLASRSNRGATSEEFLRLLMNSPYVNQRQKILNRTMIETGPGRGFYPVFTTRRVQRRLQNLPAEILCMIENHLDPSDLVCFGRTCRALYQAVDYQLVDLRNLAFAEDLWPVLSEHGLDFALAKVRCLTTHKKRQEALTTLGKERYNIMRRLHRDRLSILERQTTASSEWLPCGVCIKLHPRRYFSPRERFKPVQNRKCLASTAPIRICSHWIEDLQSLRRRREESECEPRPLDFFRTNKCVHADHEFQGFSAPKMRDIGSVLSVERSIVLLQTEHRDGLTEGVVGVVLKSADLREIAVCNHVRLGDEAVISSFRKRAPAEDDEDFADLLMAAVGHLPEFEPASCKDCGRSWQFSVFDNLGYRLSPRYALKLIVDEQIRSVRDPWTEEYLRKVEGGSELIELMKTC